jgi:hypothetical protein
MDQNLVGYGRKVEEYMDDTVTTLPVWANTAVYVLVILVLAGLTFWLIATIVRQVLASFKK